VTNECIAIRTQSRDAADGPEIEKALYPVISRLKMMGQGSIPPMLWEGELVAMSKKVDEFSMRKFPIGDKQGTAGRERMIAVTEIGVIGRVLKRTDFSHILLH
jgi:hypothetical protein